MNIDIIITEEINRYLNENIFDEKRHTKKKDVTIKKKGKKLRNGRRGDFDAKHDRDTNPNLTNQDAADLSSILDSDLIDLAAVASKLYPDHTPEGAQSQLRKKVKGLENDNGSKYHLKKKESDELLKIISGEIN